MAPACQSSAALKLAAARQPRLVRPAQCVSRDDPRRGTVATTTPATKGPSAPTVATPLDPQQHPLAATSRMCASFRINQPGPNVPHVPTLSIQPGRQRRRAFAHARRVFGMARSGWLLTSCEPSELKCSARSLHTCFGFRIIALPIPASTKASALADQHPGAAQSQEAYRPSWGSPLTHPSSKCARTPERLAQRHSANHYVATYWHPFTSLLCRSQGYIPLMSGGASPLSPLLDQHSAQLSESWQRLRQPTRNSIGCDPLHPHLVRPTPLCASPWPTGRHPLSHGCNDPPTPMVFSAHGFPRGLWRKRLSLPATHRKLDRLVCEAGRRQSPSQSPHPRLSIRPVVRRSAQPIYTKPLSPCARQGTCIRISFVSEQHRKTLEKSTSSNRNHGKLGIRISARSRPSIPNPHLVIKGLVRSLSKPPSLTESTIPTSSPSLPPPSNSLPRRSGFWAGTTLRGRNGRPGDACLSAFLLKLITPSQGPRIPALLLSGTKKPLNSILGDYLACNVNRAAC